MATLFAFIDGAIWDLDVTIMNIKTGKCVQKLQPRANKKFVASIPSIFSPKKFKAVIYNVGNVEGHDYPNLLEFRKAIKEKLDNLKIPNHYFTKDRYTPTQCLVPANISAKDGDTVVIVMGGGYTVFVTVVKFTKNGWKVMSDEKFCSMFYFTPEAMRKKIFGSIKPKNIILTSADFLESTPKYLIDILKSPNLIVIDRRNSFDNTIMEVYKNLMDKKYIKFYLSFTDLKELETSYIDTFLLEKNCHQNKITLNIDAETVATFEVKPIIFDGIKELPQTLNELNFDDKIPVIGLYDNCSVICVPKMDNENEYEFLDSWNGMYGKQLLIAFGKEEPQFCDDAEEVYQKKPSFVVTDIIDIMSQTPAELQQPKDWKFKITKDSEHPILLEFDNFDGTKMAASPAFLMAMLLKEHVKEIKKEIGQKPTKLCFCFFTPHSETE
uniref:Uncharacterized protein n=1 Tax=Panagrolaimus sp. ES5 TaxID=591445 RepID=A0AC34F464_9BILA